MMLGNPFTVLIMFPKDMYHHFLPKKRKRKGPLRPRKLMSLIAYMSLRLKVLTQKKPKEWTKKIRKTLKINLEADQIKLVQVI